MESCESFYGVGTSHQCNDTILGDALSCQLPCCEQRDNHHNHCHDCGFSSGVLLSPYPGAYGRLPISPTTGQLAKPSGLPSDYFAPLLTGLKLNSLGSQLSYYRTSLAFLIKKL